MDAHQLVYERPWIPEPIRDLIFSDARIVVCEGATKTAKTATSMLWLAEQAMAFGAPGRNFWWVSSVYGTAKIAWSRLKNGTPHGILRSNESALTHTLPNEAILAFKSAEKPDNLYGEDVYAAVADEASRWREGAWHALYTTLTATNAPVRVVHNVKGRSNWAYKLARKAEAGEPEHQYGMFTAYDAADWGIINRATVEAAKRDLPEQVFNELYLCKPTDDGGNPFGLSAIAAQVVPLADTPPLVWAWDLAKHVDWTVGIALDAAGDVCRFERWQAPWEDTIRRIVALVGRTPALVDSTGVGDPVLEALQREAPGTFEGFNFSGPSKQKLMEGLAVAIQQRQIRFPEGAIVSELESFEYEYSRTGVRYSAPEGMHDDCVMALGLAVHHWTAKRQSHLPYGWLRKEIAAERAQTDDEKLAARVAAYNASMGVTTP